MHVPVLLHDVTTLLDLSPGEFVVDGTLGRGGHATALIGKVHPHGVFLCLDRAPTRLTEVERKLSTLIQDNAYEVSLEVRHQGYDTLKAIVEEKGRKIDALLLDLGFASDQLEAERGFSFQENGPLQMTYDPEAPSLIEQLTKLSESELSEILREYSNERYHKRIARLIRLRLKEGSLNTTFDLRDTVLDAIPGSSHQKKHPATRTFQALRIFANQEFDRLQTLLNDLPEIMAEGGRVAIISFHSAEDLLVKRALHKLKKAQVGSLTTRRPITASLDEVVENPRSRSALLRGFRFTHTS